MNAVFVCCKHHSVETRVFFYSFRSTLAVYLYRSSHSSIPQHIQSIIAHQKSITIQTHSHLLRCCYCYSAAALLKSNTQCRRGNEADESARVRMKQNKKKNILPKYTLNANDEIFFGNSIAQHWCCLVSRLRSTYKHMHNTHRVSSNNSSSSSRIGREHRYGLTHTNQLHISCLHFISFIPKKCITGPKRNSKLLCLSIRPQVLEVLGACTKIRGALLSKKVKKFFTKKYDKNFNQHKIAFQTNNQSENNI